jgi:hypothetical protein
LRRNKYNVAPKEKRTVDGITFDSKREMLAYVNQFRPLMRAGIKVEMQKPFPLLANRVLGCTPASSTVISKYIADFVVTDPDGTLHVYDAKGYKTPEYRLKKKIFEANYPHLRIVEI